MFIWFMDFLISCLHNQDKNKEICPKCKGNPSLLFKDFDPEEVEYESVIGEPFCGKCMGTG